MLNSLHVKIESVEQLDVCSTKLFIWDLHKYPYECKDIPSIARPDMLRIWYSLGAYTAGVNTIPPHLKTTLNYDFQLQLSPQHSLTCVCKDLLVYPKHSKSLP